MARIFVWAPNARIMELESLGRVFAMAECGDGWWSADIPEIVHGTDYAFRLDGEGPFPDPRSPWQPEGPHGPSRWVEHDRFDWADSSFRQSPLASALIYELHTGAFTRAGTFDSVIERLEHIVDLGVTHVELMPVAEFCGERGWGYDGVDLYAPHHAYGGPEGLKRLVDACHAHGLAVLLDVVYNHLGPSGNYLGRFGPYFTDRYATPWGGAVNLDGAESDEVRRFFIDNALSWMRDYHIDGLRIDAVHAILDSSATHFLEQLAEETKELEAALGRPLVLIAESDLNDPRVVRPREIGGYGIDAQWNEDFHHSLHTLLTGECNGYYCDFGTLGDLTKVFTNAFVYDGRRSVYRKRVHGRAATGLSGHRFVACLQNHDQTGNRALGERTSALLSISRLKIGAALLMTSPFVPMLFQGEEWGASTPFLYFTDHCDPELGEAVRQGRKHEFAAFGWDPSEIPDPQSPETFARSMLDWSELENSPHAELLQWHRSLAALRRSLPDLRDGRMERTSAAFDEDERWIVLRRGVVTVAVNLADEGRSVFCPGIEKTVLHLFSEKGVRHENSLLYLPPESVAIFAPNTDEEAIF